MNVFELCGPNLYLSEFKQRQKDKDVVCQKWPFIDRLCRRIKIMRCLSLVYYRFENPMEI